MKKNLLFSVAAAAALTFSAATSGYAQLLLNENFDYVSGTQLVNNGWALVNSTVNPILVSNGGLTFAGYKSSNIGNAASLVTTGQDVNQAFAAQSTGSIYAGFLVNVSASQGPGDYFFHLTQPPYTSTTFRGRVWIKKDPTGTNFAFGLSKASTSAATITYTPYNYSLNTTYLVVLKYEFIAGAANDNVTLFVSPTLGATEPSPTLTYIDVTQTDASSLGFVALRQGTAANAPTLQIDGIRIGQTWADVTALAVMVPTLSEWGLIILGLALLGAGTFFIMRPKA